MSGQGKQAKLLTDRQVAAVLAHLQGTQHPVRNRVIFLLSAKAGLRAIEIARATWRAVTDSEGRIGEVLQLENRGSKGKRGGRTIPLHAELRAALLALHAERDLRARPEWPVIYSGKGGRGMTAASITVWFHRLYSGLGMQGCSSHSGRRTFATKAARRAVEVGASLRDVQQLLGHSSLATTQRYIEGDSDAKRKLVQLI